MMYLHVQINNGLGLGLETRHVGGSENNVSIIVVDAPGHVFRPIMKCLHHRIQGMYVSCYHER